ncbi:hypothetical protein Tco_0756510 [Tanacetum coccineum]
MAPMTLSTSESVSHIGSCLPPAQPSTHGGVEPANRPMSSGWISYLFIDIQLPAIELLNSKDHANFFKKLTETVLSADLVFLIRSEHIPKDSKTCVSISKCELSALNSASNVVLEGNWVSHH